MASGAAGGAPGVCASAVTDSRIEFAAAVVTPVATRRRTKSRREIVLVSDLQAGSRLDALQAYEWPKGVELIVEPVKARFTFASADERVRFFEWFETWFLRRANPATTEPAA